MLACSTLLACACAPEPSTFVEAAGVLAAESQLDAAESHRDTTESHRDTTEEPPLVLRVTQPDTSD